MSQSDFGTMDPATVSGTALANALNAFRTALNSGHGGASRPSYAIAGTTWVKTVSATAHEVYYYDGADDILMGVVNPTTNVFVPAGVQSQAGKVYTTGGSSTAFTLTTSPVLGALTSGEEYDVTFNAAAGATPTLARDGLTAKSLKYRDSTGAKQAVTATQVPSGWRSRVVYDGTDYVVREVPPVNVVVGKNYVTNGSFAVNQVVTATTADNTYPIDEWRLLLGAANAATFSQDTSDVPTGAGYAAKLTVGSGNNNKFGLFHPIENKDMLDLRGGVCSLRVPLKATAGLTDGSGKIRIGILQWVGTADSISATPISSWGAEGTDPTLITSWSFANTPAALSVTTAWVDYLVENVSISASATNIGILIWSDDKTNTTTTDILRIGGYVTLGKSATAPSAQVAPIAQELMSCRRKFQKSWNQGTAAGATVSPGSVVWTVGETGAVSYCGQTTLNPPMRTTPTVTLYSPSTGATGNIRDVSTASDVSASADVIGETGFSLNATLTANRRYIHHYTANARL